MSKIMVCVQFLCTACKQVLVNPGAARTDDEHIYITGWCEDCEEQMPIDLEHIIHVLYETPKGRVN